MKTLDLFHTPPEVIPAHIGWYLADLGEALGKQELFTAKSPQNLETLREHAIIESAVSSNRIEGVERCREPSGNSPGCSSAFTGRIHGNCGLRKLHRPGPLIFEYQDADFSCSTEAKEPLKLTMNELRLDSSRIGPAKLFDVAGAL